MAESLNLTRIQRNKLSEQSWNFFISDHTQLIYSPIMGGSWLMSHILSLVATYLILSLILSRLGLYSKSVINLLSYIFKIKYILINIPLDFWYKQKSNPSILFDENELLHLRIHGLCLKLKKWYHRYYKFLLHKFYKQMCHNAQIVIKII